MFQMSFSASRATRLIVAVGVAWLGLALSAQAAHATYGKITIVKINKGGNLSDSFAFAPALTPAAGSFSLTGAADPSTVVAANKKTFSVECNVGSGCNTAPLAVAETPRAGYTLTDITCRYTQGSNGFSTEPTTANAVTPAAETTKDLAKGSVNLKVHLYEWVKCWYTNTLDTGTIKVTKVLAPATDAGKFNLLVDGTAKATNVGNGGTTGVQTVLPGTHTVGEAAGTATDLANYDSATSCVDTAHAAKPADTDGSVQVANGDTWECVITNTRKSSPPPPPPPGDEPPAVQPPAEQAVSPQIAVSPARVRPGSARLSGPSGCPTTSAVAATVSGRRIVKVTFYVDGRKVKTLTKANRNGRWVLPMNVKRFAFGTHRVRVTVQFARSSQTKARTLRLSFSRCHPAVVKPQFTG
jgi:hypothetical protein